MSQTIKRVLQSKKAIQIAMNCKLLKVDTIEFMEKFGLDSVSQIESFILDPENSYELSYFGWHSFCKNINCYNGFSYCKGGKCTLGASEKENE